MTDQLDTLFGRLWAQYTKLNPDAEKIHKLLTARGERILNDHVAFRTFRHDKTGIERLAAPFEALGYEPQDPYHFEEKKLFARYWRHPDPDQPKVFISELLTDQLSPDAQKRIAGLIDQVDADECKGEEFLTAGRLWATDSETYEALAKESEYAAWMAAFGFCANHFTVSVNDLTTFDSLEDLTMVLIENGFPMNTAGGLIKGSPDVYLEQSSTLAAKITVPFTDGEMEIPSCYYEFAKRYVLPKGDMYQGFVTASADKIFESTDR